MTVFEALRDTEGSKFQLLDTKLFLPLLCTPSFDVKKIPINKRRIYEARRMAPSKKDEMKCKFYVIYVSTERSCRKFLFAIILHAFDFGYCTIIQYASRGDLLRNST